MPSPSALAMIEHSNAVQRINAAHSKIVRHGEQMISFMIECGDELLAARAHVPSGKWAAWIEENLDFTPKTARLYMRFATYKEVLRQHNRQTQLDAKKLLADVHFPALNDTTDQRRRAEELRAKGLTIREIAAELGVTHGGVMYWFNSEKIKERHKRKSRAARRAAQAEERARSVSAKGGGVAVAYGHIRLSLEALQRASGDGGAEERRAISTAMSALYRAEDAVVKASRCG